MEVENFYDYVDDENNELYDYPNYDKVQIKLPARIMVVGPSGSGKTNITLSIFKCINKFSKVIICAADTEETLYKWLTELLRGVEKKTKTQILTLINSPDELPHYDSFDKEENTFLVIDDQICAGKKALEKVANFWIRGRKKSITMLFLTQSYYDTPRKIRINSTYIAIKEVEAAKDLRRMLKEYKFKCSFDRVMEIYDYAIDGGKNTDFLLINTRDKEFPFRKQYKPIPNWSDQIKS